VVLLQWQTEYFRVIIFFRIVCLLKFRRDREKQVCQGVVTP